MWLTASASAALVRCTRSWNLVKARITSSIGRLLPCVIPGCLASSTTRVSNPRSAASQRPRLQPTALVTTPTTTTVLGPMLRRHLLDVRAAKAAATPSWTTPFRRDTGSDHARIWPSFEPVGSGCPCPCCFEPRSLPGHRHRLDPHEHHLPHWTGRPPVTLNVRHYQMSLGGVRFDYLCLTIPRSCPLSKP